MSDAVAHAKLLGSFHNRYWIIPDYEHILECNYRRLIGPANAAFDIGANIGRHTRIFSEIVGPQGPCGHSPPHPARIELPSSSSVVLPDSRGLLIIDDCVRKAINEYFREHKLNLFYTGSTTAVGWRFEPVPRFRHYF